MKFDTSICRVNKFQHISSRNFEQGTIFKKTLKIATKFPIMSAINQKSAMKNNEYAQLIHILWKAINNFFFFKKSVFR